MLRLCLLLTGFQKGEVAHRILSVGSSQRAQLISTLLEPLSPGEPLFQRLSSRGFLTITGKPAIPKPRPFRAAESAPRAQQMRTSICKALAFSPWSSLSAQPVALVMRVCMVVVRTSHDCIGPLPLHPPLQVSQLPPGANVEAYVMLIALPPLHCLQDCSTVCLSALSAHTWACPTWTLWYARTGALSCPVHCIALTGACLCCTGPEG